MDLKKPCLITWQNSDEAHATLSIIYWKSAPLCANGLTSPEHATFIMVFNSLGPGTSGWDFKNTIFSLLFHWLVPSEPLYDNALRWMSQDGKSISAQVMACCRSTIIIDEISTLGCCLVSTKSVCDAMLTHSREIYKHIARPQWVKALQNSHRYMIYGWLSARKM